MTKAEKRLGSPLKLSASKIGKFEKSLAKGIDKEIKDSKSKLTKEEKIELKSFAIKKALKLKRYVRN